MKKSKFSDSEIFSILKRVRNGSKVSDICEEYGISSSTFYKWRAKYGNENVASMSQNKQLEEENRKLKTLLNEERKKSKICQEALQQVVKNKSELRDVVKGVIEPNEVSVRLACSAVGISETAFRYQPKQNEENDRIADLLLKLTDENDTWGFGLCFKHMRDSLGHGWNRKRVRRIYCKLNLNKREDIISMYGCPQYVIF